MQKPICLHEWEKQDAIWHTRRMACLMWITDRLIAGPFVYLAINWALPDNPVFNFTISWTWAFLFGALFVELNELHAKCTDRIRRSEDEPLARVIIMVITLSALLIAVKLGAF